MSDQPRRVIGPAPRSTPATTRAGASRWELPRDLQRQAARRLGFMSLLTCALWVVSTILYHYLDRVVAAGDSAWLGFQPSDAIVATGALVSLAMFAYTRRSDVSPARMLDLGLLYMIVTAFMIGVLLHWEARLTSRNMAPAISWIGVMVLMFAATLPNRPIKIVAAGVVAVSMNPVGMLISRARGRWDFDHAAQAWLMHYPDLLLVGVAAIIVRVVFNLTRHVAKAREMGSYKLGELIGRGGMGEVYRATHLMLARPAAIKLMRPEMIAARTGGGAEMAEARFRREAEAAASLRSPHTVELYDFGVTEDGTLYFAMELLEGMDLQSLVQRTGPMPAARVIYILEQVAESLEEAHARGLVHRDIKPANIHAGIVGLRYDFAKVLDFGLVTAPAGNAMLSTAAGVVPGTPAYMAPEMALGEPLDGRADIYSLGCVAYFLLTGTVVFDAEGAMQTIVRRLHEDPAPPSTRTEMAIPPALDALVLACLARRASDRPQSSDLAHRLRAIDTEPWNQEKAAKWWSLNLPAHAAEPGDPTRTGSLMP